MIAILDAKSGMTDALRELIIELGVQVRDEHGRVAFTVYEARDVEGRFLETAHVKHFIQRLPSVSPSSQEANLFQLDEIEFHPT